MVKGQCEFCCCCSTCTFSHTIMFARIFVAPPFLRHLLQAYLLVISFNVALKNSGRSNF